MNPKRQGNHQKKKAVGRIPVQSVAAQQKGPVQRHPKQPADRFTVICLWLIFGILLAMSIGIWQIILTGVFLSGQGNRDVSSDSFLLTQNNRIPGRSQNSFVPDWVTQDILPLNEYSRPGTRLDIVNGVVVHYTGNPGTTAEQNRSYYEQLASTHETKVSSHFIIGMDGVILQCVPLNEIAYCSNHRNSDTISIECCHMDKDGKFSKATLESLTKLLEWLAQVYGLHQEQILRHYDVTGKECPIYYVKHPDEWEHFLDQISFYP